MATSDECCVSRMTRLPLPVIFAVSIVRCAGCLPGWRPILCFTRPAGWWWSIARVR
ncbi:hypothetical protein KQS06HV_50933 [Klebsiella quasipneumoniae subsp. similipneumoniae]|nr:hypothetical protein KQS06HV_50933 [Klebsiella quasipneumoniae subsp. similipneumoniae]